jgi:hypothetical protein
MSPSKQSSKVGSTSVTTNLLLCAELADLCLQLRYAVLRQQGSEAEARRKVTAEIVEAKERVWQRNSTY